MPESIVFFAVVGVVASTRVSEAIFVTMQGAKPVCADLPTPALHCLSERQGWVALNDVVRVFQAQGWTVTPARATAPDVPGVWNDVLRVEARGFRFDLPNGPDRVNRARLESRGVLLPPDQTTLRRAEETFVQADALFGRLASLTEVPVTVKQALGRSTVMLADTQITFAFEKQDPAAEVLWQTVGVALAHEFGLTVAAEREPRGLKHNLQMQMSEPGTYVVVYRHPSAVGVGYILAQTDEAGYLQAKLPIKALNLVSDPRLAWQSPGAVSVSHFTGRMNGSAARLNPPNRILWHR